MYFIHSLYSCDILFTKIFFFFFWNKSVFFMQFFYHHIFMPIFHFAFFQDGRRENGQTQKENGTKKKKRKIQKIKKTRPNARVKSPSSLFRCSAEGVVMEHWKGSSSGKHSLWGKKPDDREREGKLNDWMKC